MRLSIKPLRLASFETPGSLRPGLKPFSTYNRDGLCVFYILLSRIIIIFSWYTIPDSNRQPLVYRPKLYLIELIVWVTSRDVPSQLLHILLRYTIQHTSCLSSAEYLTDVAGYFGHFSPFSLILPVALTCRFELLIWLLLGLQISQAGSGYLSTTC